jgi:hypothetical protein
MSNSMDFGPNVDMAYMAFPAAGACIHAHALLGSTRPRECMHSLVARDAVTRLLQEGHSAFILIEIKVPVTQVISGTRNGVRS